MPLLFDGNIGHVKVLEIINDHVIMEIIIEEKHLNEFRRLDLIKYNLSFMF